MATIVSEIECTCNLGVELLETKLVGRTLPLSQVRNKGSGKYLPVDRLKRTAPLL